MNPAEYSLSTEREHEVNELGSKNMTLPNNDPATLPNGFGSQRLHQDSIVALDLDSQVPRSFKENLVVVDSNNKNVPYDCCWVVTNDDKNPSLVSHNGGSIHETVPFNTQGVHKVSVSSGTGSLSELSSEGGYESLESMTPDPNVIYSEYDLYSARKSIIDESDENLMVSSLSKLSMGCLFNLSLLTLWSSSRLMCRNR